MTVIACDLAEPLTVTVLDGETMADALLRELRAATATLRTIHNSLIGDDETPGGERLRSQCLEAVKYTAEQESEATAMLYAVLKRLRPTSTVGYPGGIVAAVERELDRVVDVIRSPLALLPARSETWT